MNSIKAPFFRTAEEVDQYFAGDRIKCLICGMQFRRLWAHLAAKHKTSVDDYRVQFGLPWTRGLTSSASNAAAGWTPARKKKARKLAKKTRFFELAHASNRRQLAPFLKEQAIQNLGKHAVGFGDSFERQVRILFAKGLTDGAIAKKLGVGRATVTYRTMHWRKQRRRLKTKPSI
jgi:ROS/MUCR transcriptional regulator protein